MLVAYCRLCHHCFNLAEGGCLLLRFRCFLGYVACQNLPWQGLFSSDLCPHWWASESGYLSLTEFHLSSCRNQHFHKNFNEMWNTWTWAVHKFLVFCLYCTLLREAREYGYSSNIRLILADLATERGKQAERWLLVPNLLLRYWSSQLFGLRMPLSTDIPVLLQNQPIFLKQHIVCFQEIYMLYPIPGHKCG